MKAPFPWFGGKSRVSDFVWDRFGCVPNYVEPFAGSLAVLLGRRSVSGTETVNDKDAYLANFWRAIKQDPEGTAAWADWPVSEADLLARHRWLVESAAERLLGLRTDPMHHDSMVAGWWVWGLCSWIGSGWCRERGDGHQSEQIPHLGDAGMGINRNRFRTSGTRGGASIGNSRTSGTRGGARGSRRTLWSCPHACVTCESARASGTECLVIL